MNYKKYGEMILGIIIIVIGAVYCGLTTEIPRKGIIDATFIPYILVSLMFLLGVLQLVAGYKAMRNFTDETGRKPVKEEEKPDYRTVLRTVISIVLYIAFIDMIGFLIMTALFLFAQFIILTPVDKQKNYLSYAGIAIVTAVVVYFTFRDLFDLMLPEGLLY